MYLTSWCSLSGQEGHRAVEQSSNPSVPCFQKEQWAAVEWALQILISLYFVRTKQYTSGCLHKAKKWFRNNQTHILQLAFWLYVEDIIYFLRFFFFSSAGYLFFPKSKHDIRQLQLYVHFSLTIITITVFATVRIISPDPTTT